MARLRSLALAAMVVFGGAGLALIPSSPASAATEIFANEPTRPCAPGESEYTVSEEGYIYEWKCNEENDWELEWTNDPYFYFRGSAYSGPFLKANIFTRLDRILGGSGLKIGSTTNVKYANNTRFYGSTVLSFTDIQRWNGSSWDWCGNGTGWSSIAGHSSIGSFRTYTAAPCGSGYYRTIGYSYFVLNGTWFGGTGASTSAYISGSPLLLADGGVTPPPTSDGKACLGRTNFRPAAQPKAARDLLISGRDCRK